MKIVLTGVLLLFLLNSCDNQEDEQLNPDASKKVLLLQVDYDDYTFNSGKEFSYFIDNSTTASLPATANIVTNASNQRVTVLYGSSKDTIFDGLEILNGVGARYYPSIMDNQMFYFKITGSVAQPAQSSFQTIQYDMIDPIPYDSIWKGVSSLQIVQEYRGKNPSSNVGIFLFRPSKGASTNDWKWFLLIRD